MEDQELVLKFQMFEQQIKQIQQQLEAVEHAIQEMNFLTKGLEELKGKTGEEIFAQVGRGIFVKAKLISEELIMDTGNKNFVSKDIDSTKKTIEEQIKKLENAQGELEDSMIKIEQELTTTYLEHQEKSSKCNCGDECSCEKEKNN